MDAIFVSLISTPTPEPLINLNKITKCLQLDTSVSKCATEHRYYLDQCLLSIGVTVSVSAAVSTERYIQRTLTLTIQ